MVDANFGRPAHLRRHYLPFEFFSVLLCSFCRFHQIEVLVKEKEEKRAVTFIHIINFFFRKRDVFPPFTQSFIVMPGL